MPAISPPIRDLESAVKNISALLRQQATLAEFGELALRSDDLDGILTEACRLVGRALGTELAKVVELQEDGKTLLVRAGVGWKAGVVGVATIILADKTSESLALKTGEPMISTDIGTEARFTYAPFLIENGVRAVANVPIIGGRGRPPFGILQIDSREPRQFEEIDTTFLRGYANLVAAAVDRLRSLDDLRKSEAQVRHLQKLEAIGQLATGVAHDVNNVLQSVSGGLELILESIDPATEMYPIAQIALNSARRGSSLTHHLLSYARKQLLRPKHVDVAPFLAEMQQLLDHTIGQQIAIELRADPALPSINVDPGQLQTALLNLAINASHAMPHGGGLRLDARECTEAQHPYVVISVVDDGVGMDGATMARAFDPFFSTKGLAGSGLGLSMVQGFVEQSGGKVRIESTPGHGTRVELWLPSTIGASSSTDAAHCGPVPTRGAGRILLVDDDPGVVSVLGTLLERAGFMVVTANSANKAMVILDRGERFDVLVTDYAMHAVNGVELIRRARTVQPGLRSLLISGFADVNTPLPEAVTVLSKPFRRQELVEAVLNTAPALGPEAVMGREQSAGFAVS